jgi:pentatricopeptide repeat protein
MWFQIEDNTMIAYVHGSDMDTAFAHQSWITTAGGVPSPDTYGSLVGCVKDTTDDTSNALALFAEFQMLGTKPNVYLYHMIISKLTKACKADFALELFQQVTTYTSLHPSSITCGAVIAACARVGDTVAAEQLFVEMMSQPNCTHIQSQTGERCYFIWTR